jgi:DNA recombination protein RmuC
MDTLAIALTLLVGLVVGGLATLLVLRARRAAGPPATETLQPMLAELTRSAVAEALGTSGMQLSDQLRQATEERLRTQQEAAESQARAAQEMLQRIVEPLTQGVTKLDTQVRALEQARADAYGRLHEQVMTTATTLESLQQATQRLGSAMSSNQVRGQWGELQLQRIVELVGLKEHVSYEQQVQQIGEGTGRPDLTVHLTDGKVLYVDAKAPMAAFVRALEIDDRAQQKAQLLQHARDLLGHVKVLAERGYLDDGASIGLVALFVPNEAALAAALDADPELLSKALAQRVVVTGPTSLAMMLTNVSASWRQQNLAENAERIVGEVLELHKRLGTFTDHLAKVGQHLGRSVSAFNSAVSSFERRLLPAARKVEQLAAVPESERLGDLVELESAPTLSAGDAGDAGDAGPEERAAD